MRNKTVPLNTLFIAIWFITGITVCTCATQLAIDTLAPTAAIPMSFLTIVLLESIGYCVLFCQAMRWSTPTQLALYKCLVCITPAALLSAGAVFVVISANGLLTF